MASSTITWISSWLVPCLAGIPLLDTPLISNRTSRVSSGLIALILLSLASFWERRVTRIVPEPYLDEVFHIPQAQAYCLGRYDEYDPKLTTPPGLYIFATLFAKVWPNSSPKALCSDFILPHILRFFNCLALVMTMFYACDCRAMITRTWNSALSWDGGVWVWKNFSRPLNADSLHTALNIALFPPLFFFSGLFYTDILSTCVVLRVYKQFLESTGDSWNSAIWIYITGLISLTMRQTNIFWVAVFMGGLEVVRCFPKSQVKGRIQVSGSWLETIQVNLKGYRQGGIHDPQLNDAAAHDFIICAISIGVAALYRPITVLAKLVPYIALLASFVGFVYWNGGVVLGDKSNHVATIHLPQMLYIFAFTTFFSSPLIIPTGITFLTNLIQLLSIPLFPRLVWKYILVTIYIAAALGLTLLIIKYNTIIHPFTLADNRHYMFYIFRYTILRHPLIRYLLAPIYVGCAYLVYLTLCTPGVKSLSPNLKTSKSTNNSGSMKAKKQNQITGDKEDKPQGPTTSFTLILLITTALSLITAPLVEPRYFIIPWVIWRLNVPSLNAKPAASINLQTSQIQNKTLTEKIRYWGWEGHDYRLWIETAWFLVINVVTGGVFLYRGFSWEQEPGKVQRFMW